jgi:peptide/nickel transport system substrate-binding protein
MNRLPLLALRSALIGVLACTPALHAQAPADKPLVYAMYADIKDWDPSVAASTEAVLLSNVYETLVGYRPEAKPALVPALATAWTSSKDGRTWTFTLRKNVLFHDGSAFDAAAAKASIERTIKLAKGSAYIWDAVESVGAPDSTTLVIKTKTATPVDLIASSQYAAYMISPKAMAGGTDWFSQGQDGGTGPYRVKSWARGQNVSLERFDAYWGGWQPRQVAAVQLRVVQEAATQAQLIRSGEADVITLPSADLVQALAKEPGVVVLRGNSWRNTQMLINTRKPPTDNVAFRQALAYAWDYAAVVDKIYEGGATAAHGVVPATLWGHDPKLRMPQLDLARARTLLAQSGVPPAQRKLVATYIGTSEEYKNSLLVFKANLAKIGIELELRPGPWGKIWDEAKQLETAPNLISMTWWPAYATPSDWLVGLFRSEKQTVFNLSHYANPAYDERVNRGLALEAVDRTAAIAQYSQAQQMLIDDAVAIFVADLGGRVIHRKSLTGVEINPAYDGLNFYRLRR